MQVWKDCTFGCKYKTDLLKSVPTVSHPSGVPL